jgi:hypothetical protein
MPSSDCPNTSVTDLTWNNEHHGKLTLTDEIIDNLSNNNSKPSVFSYAKIDNSHGNLTYTPATLTKQDILENRRYVLCSFGIASNNEELDLLSLHLIPC